MLPLAVANTSAYAGLWSHLKSVEHAVERALSLGNTAKLSELDRDRLQALSALLSMEASAGQAVDIGNFLHVPPKPSEPDFTASIDLRAAAVEVPEFQVWLQTSKKGVETKLDRLRRSVDDLLKEDSPLIARRIPVEEFEVMRAILRHLSKRAEAALY